MNKWALRAIMTLAVISLPALATAQPWWENFDAYANGSGLHGQGGWRGWDGNAAYDAFVTNVQSRSAPHSVNITPTSDIVQQFVGANSGQWIMTGWCYIPTGSSGEQYFILLNDYNEGGAKNWSTQIVFNSTLGTVRDFDNPAGVPLPIVFNQWVEIRVDIDLTADTQSIFYDGTLLNTKSWTDGASGSGDLNIEALDLYSNAGTSIYWDDLSLVHGGPVSIDEISWGETKALFR